MGNVTQQNAANAEESASASEEMNAQAAQMKGVVGELIALVGGSAKGVESRKYAGGTKEISIGRGKAVAAPEEKTMVQEVKSDQVIPMASLRVVGSYEPEAGPEGPTPRRDEGDFKDF